MSEKNDDIFAILEAEKSAGLALDDSIFMGQMDLMKEVEEVDDSLFPDDLLHELTDERALSKDEKINFFKMVKDMNVAQKIKLGLMGNKEARDILLREQNKMILRAVMKNPRMQINEAIKLSQSRNVSDEVLRLITQNREWMRTYGIKKELVFNPRTPLPISIKLFRVLREHDIKSLAHNKDVHSTIAKMAKRYMDELAKKKSGKKPGGH